MSDIEVGDFVIWGGGGFPYEVTRTFIETGPVLGRGLWYADIRGLKDGAEFQGAPMANMRKLSPEELAHERNILHLLAGGDQ